MTAAAVGDLLGIPTATVYRLARNGTLPIRALLRSRSLPVVVTVTFTPSGGRPVTRSARVTLPKRPSPRRATR
ncbi:hypothetical protein Q5424_09845 [Conexibacter sp. JD483]|uniref:hypothetical protein n=1 Tax=unclassified Conexibacter TaxID=2627773 RepID=UPI0027158A1A|nr:MULTISPECIES: hypothetical protein [unclassified Conexibacter]MDO8187704.1 hypothetical protein [Conexibacter sp. CPCC 205706]MDO8200207.1 hypothetical protein [Conexibacter sp. CPCC 205762]MDR9369383.1 hypothetical protein [Conexibacter sp. JD483]